MVMQTENVECGLACVAMVAAFHGRNDPLRALRERFAVSAKGTTLARLLDIAAHIGLHGRAVRLELEDLSRLQTPAVLHWNLNHYVVLARANRTHAWIHDPARGERKLRIEEVSKSFTGVALELAPASDFVRTPKHAVPGIRSLIGPVRGLGLELARILLLSLALQVLLVIAPFYMQWTIDHALLSADRDLLGLLAVGFLFVLGFQVAISAMRSWVVNHVATSVGLQSQSNVLAHLLRLPLEYFEKRHLGDVVSRMGSVQTIQRTLSTVFVEAVLDGLMAIVTVSIMLAYSPRLACITLGAVALYLGLRLAVFGVMRDATEHQILASARQQTHLMESILGIQSIKLATRELLRRTVWQNLLVDTTNKELHLARLRISFQSANQLIFGAERIAVIWLGSVLALENVFSVGMLIAYLAYKDQFATRVSTLIDRWTELRMLRLHGERIGDIVLEPVEQPESATVLPSRRDGVPAIELRNVSFRYAEGEPWIVNACSLSVAAGESIALVGPSGCGKTTVIKLMLGLLKPITGSVHVNGRDLAHVDRQAYYGMLGTVMQDDQVFAGSVADNISFFDMQADQAGIARAAELAGIDEEIEDMPMGYATYIGDMGSALSGGQKQRLVLARALYRRPEILFLDEATSSLDVEREKAINDNVARLDITKVVVAHRPETIAAADRVLVLAGGAVTREYAPRARHPVMELTP